ncbi:unnamed protein product [Prorocentrum cordatum]|uniref:Amino acid transporter transmembrane domain-containing protein n=1 Tax=Prorocentrum cordatum TaxID=2364126 RepID=A0ABN9UI16_9DINO|nr:unnamed protein product [Polarella glacialis]
MSAIRSHFGSSAARAGPPHGAYWRAPGAPARTPMAAVSGGELLLPKVRHDDRAPGSPLTQDIARHKCSAGEMPFYSAVFNLTNTIIGTGTLTMPFIFAQVGWLAGNVISVVVMLFTLFSAYLLVVASDNVGGDGARSFESLGYLCCGALGSVYAECTFIFGGLGTCTGYMIFIGQLIAQVTGLGVGQAYIPIMLAMLFIVVPLAWPRNIHALRYTSVLAIVAILYVVVMYAYLWATIGRYNYPSHRDVYKEPHEITVSLLSVNSLNLLIGAYCVQNTCLPIYGELRCRSPKRMIGATACAMLVSFAVYEVIGLSGYFLFGGGVPSNSLLSLDEDFVIAHPWTKWARGVAKVLMSCSIALSVPLAIWPCRSAICSVIMRARVGCLGPALGSELASDGLFHGVTLVFLAIVTLLALLIPDVTIPLGLVNSLAGGSMIFVMPGLFYLGSLEKHRRFSWSSFHAFAMIAAGLAVCVLGFGLQLKSILHQFGTDGAGTNAS